MLDIEALYFDWLLTRLDPDGVSEEVAHVCNLLHRCDFQRRIGRDINRAIDGANLRNEFMRSYDDADFDPHVTNDLMLTECSWFEMMTALAERLDYLYDGGVENRFMEMVKNLGLTSLLSYHHEFEEEDQLIVDEATALVDESRFNSNGGGGIFPLRGLYDHPDQREVEIWDQQAAYFRENLDLF